MPSLWWNSQREPEPIVRDPLHFELGDIKVALDEDPKSDLLLNSDLLLEVSAFFNGSKKDWAHNAKTVHRAATDEELKCDSTKPIRDVNIVTYYLSRVGEGVFMLETTQPSSRAAVGVEAGGHLFYLSEFASGFCSRSSDTKFVGVHEGLSRARSEHRLLFELLFKTYQEDDLSKLDYTGLANLVALAEAYDMIDFVAPSIRANLMKREDLWQDVRNEYKFHLALSAKLRCEEVFYDALRHLIGSGDDLSFLVDELDCDPAVAFKIAMLREQLKKAEDKLSKDLQTLTLANYLPHARKNDHPDREKTTHAASKLELEDRSRIQQHAHSIILETFTHHLCGRTHWSHVREYNGWPSGVFSKSSLRNFCNAITEACQTDTILDLFAPSAANDIESTEDEYNNGKKPYLTLEVEEEIKKVITQMSNTALPYMAPPDFRPVTVCTSADMRGCDPVYDQGWPNDSETFENPITAPGRGRGRGRGGMRGVLSGRGGARGRGRPHPEPYHGNERRATGYYREGFKRVGMTANDDSDCHYFTCIDFGDEELHPWEEDFEGYVFEGLKPASEEWKKKIGLGVDDLAE